MDSTTLPVSLSLSAQKTLSLGEPLSAELLNYRLSRTPTPRRFSRNWNGIPPKAQEQGLHGQDNQGLSNPDFRSASELFNRDVAAGVSDQSERTTRGRPAPKHNTTPSSSAADPYPTQQPDGLVFCSHGFADRSLMATEPEVPETSPDSAHVSGEETDDMSLNDAIRKAALISGMELARMEPERDILPLDVEKDRAFVSQTHASEAQLSSRLPEKKRLRRPTKRTPLPSGPPIEQHLVSQQTSSSRQLSIPDEEWPAKSKQRPRARRNLPVDVLELAEERLPSYDAPLIFDSENSDSDPVEEQTDDGVRSQQAIRQQKPNRSAKATKKKPLSVRSRRQRSDILAGFKALKRPAVSAVAGQKKTLEGLTVGDAFEGPERLATGRTMPLAKPRRGVRWQASRPKLYFRPLEIVEYRPYEAAVQRDESSLYAGYTACDSITDGRAMQQAAGPLSVSPERVREVESCLNLPMDQGHLKESVEVSLLIGIEEDAHRMEIAQFLESSMTRRSRLHTESHIQSPPLDASKPREELTIVSPDAQIRPDESDISIVQLKSPHQTPGQTQRHPLPPTEERQKLDHDPTQYYPELPHREPVADNGMKTLCGNKLNRRVTFSNEVKIQTEVESEYEDEDDPTSEAQSPADSGRESEQESDQSQDITDESDAAESLEEYDDKDGFMGDTDDEDHDYSTGNHDGRSGSPELVSSGYYAASSSSTQPYFNFHAYGMACRSSDDEGSSEYGEDGMILDMDEEPEDLPELSPKYYYASAILDDDFLDSDEEMLIATSRAAEREFQSGYDGNDAKDTAAMCGRGRRMTRKEDERAREDEAMLNSDLQLLSNLSRSRSSAERSGTGDNESPSAPRTRRVRNIFESDNYQRSSDDNDESRSRCIRAQCHLTTTASAPGPRSTQNIATSREQDRELSHAPKADRTNMSLKYLALTLPTSPVSFISKQRRDGSSSLNAPRYESRKVKRAKTGVAHMRKGSPTRQVTVTDVPSYFTQASQALSSPLKDINVMMRRARTLPSTQYVSESGDEDGFIISDESFRERSKGRKRHLSLSDSVEDRGSMDLKELIKLSSMDMGTSLGQQRRKRSLLFKTPLKGRVAAT